MSDGLDAKNDTEHDLYEQELLPASGHGAHSSVGPLQPHNKRLSMVSGTPARVSTDSPDVHVSLVQPGSMFKTPYTEHATSQDDDPLAAEQPAQDLQNIRSSDYFSPFAASSHTFDTTPDKSPETAAHAALSRQTTRSSETTQSTRPEHLDMESSLEDRLAAQRESIAVASTFRSAAPSGSTVSDSRRGKPRRSMTEHPHYPNQSLAALSTQVYPEVHHAPYSSRPTSGRQQGQRPSALLSQLSSPSNSGDERQARTVGNTPIQTPSLFSPRAPRYPPTYDASGESPVPSPYLHPVQPQAPRETYKAVRDMDSSSGRKTINQYEILYEIGKGTHGKVKLARDILTGDYAAIKIVQRFAKRRRLGKAHDQQEDKVKKEIAILKKALHPNVVSMIEVIDDPDLHKIYLVLEFCESHDVKWREIGESEIILMENQRLRREKEGTSDLESLVDPERLLRVAKKRRERTHKHRRPLSRIGSESEFWSLEYAGDSEPEEDMLTGSTPTSRATSHPSSGQVPPPSIEQGHLSSAASMYSTPKDDHHGHAPGCPEAQAADDTNFEDPGFTSFSDFNAKLQQLENERSQTPGDDYQGRKPSLAESTSSMVSEIVEHTLPEDMRYVPLLTIAEARCAFRDALLGIEYLHYQGVIHRDIKPENLLRKADQCVKISDFGVSYLGKPVREGRESEETSDAEGTEFHEDETDLAKTVGTPAFYAPELCDLGFTEDKPHVTGQIDVWALGVTLFCFLYARLPFQATNEFVMMRRVVEDDVFFSRKRLKAIDPTARGRPASHDAQYDPQFRNIKDYRLPHEVVYDEIDDDLHDLLKRLLAKDPSKRISVREIKHHPWVLCDIPNPMKWLDDTDPVRLQQGRKIEISKEEIHEAVAPLRLVERAKSVVKKAIGGLTSLGGSSRKRGQSSAASSEANSPAPISPQSHPNSQPDHSRSEESIATILKASREQLHHQSHPEHPLSQSVTASPELPAIDKVAASSSDTAFAGGRLLDVHDLARPSLPDRHESVMSTATSIRTVRQSDISAVDRTLGPDATEQHCIPQEPYSGQFMNMFGEVGRSLLRTVRSRDRNAPEGRSPSSAPLPLSSSDAQEHLQGQPSVALSSTSASGHLTHAIPDTILDRSKRTSLSSQPRSRIDPVPERERRRSHQIGLAHIPSYLQLSPPSPAQSANQVRRAVSSNSSEDHLNPAISRETSFPSVPSVVSADSSVVPDASGDDLPELSFKAGVRHTGAVAAAQSGAAPSGPLVLASDDRPPWREPEEHPATDEDDSDSDEDFLVMNRTKSRTANTPKMSGRSGSTNTVKKRSSRELTPLDSGSEERPRGRQPP